MTVKQAAEKWGVSSRQVQHLCSKGRIKGAKRFGGAWMIPADAEKPPDTRKFTGKDRTPRKPKNKDGDHK